MLNRSTAQAKSIRIGPNTGIRNTSPKRKKINIIVAKKVKCSRDAQHSTCRIETLSNTLEAQYLHATLDGSVNSEHSTFMCSWFFHVGFRRSGTPCLETGLGLGPKDRQRQHSNWQRWDPSVWPHVPRPTAPTHSSSPEIRLEIWSKWWTGRWE